jgi:IPT/TIG domain-containing protein/Big-like domain-containing protein
MRKIVTAVSAASLALSMLAMAVPASAVTGYDSAYAGESAFVNISPGQTQNFQVFFANTGTTTWSRGTSTQVDLAACLEDKTTCNAQDATEASWNSGWLSATRYASTVQTTTAPGSLGTFSYNITAPVGATNGTYRFNGDLVLSTTGEKIHPDGYYQDATIGGPQSGAAVLTTCVNSTTSTCGGSSSGGETVVLGGTGFVCTPAFPSVSFGGTNAVVTSCGSTSVTTVSPAHAPGAVAVTLTNSGAPASNGLTYTYADTARPVYTAISVNGNIATVTWSEPVCKTGALNAAAWNITTNSAPNAVTGDFANLCDSVTAATNGTTTTQLLLTNSAPPGSFIEGTLLQDGAGSGKQDFYRDGSGNGAAAPQTRTNFAGTPDTTKPTITSVMGTQGSTTITLNFSEPVWCGDGNGPDLADITVTPTSGAALGSTGADTCATAIGSATMSFTVTLGGVLQSAMTYTLAYPVVGADEVQDVAGNDLAAVAGVTFNTNAGDFTPPTLTDARMVFNAGPSTDFSEAGDSFSVTFSEKMNGATNGTVSIQDQDGTTATIQCSAVVAANQATCGWDSTVTVMNVALTGSLTSGSGTTPGMQIPFNITAMSLITDTSTNPPNILGSSDRLVDYE